MCVLSPQSCLILCDPVNCILPVSSVHGDSPGENNRGAAMPSSRGSFPPRDRTHDLCGSCIAGRFFTSEVSSLGIGCPPKEGSLNAEGDCSHIAECIHGYSTGMLFLNKLSHKCTNSKKYYVIKWVVGELLKHDSHRSYSEFQNLKINTTVI